MPFYKLKNVGANKYLNITGTTSFIDNQNVNVNTACDTVMQTWEISSLGNNVYVRSISDNSFSLNKWGGTVNTNNCDIYPIHKNAEKDCKINFISATGGYKIKLTNQNLYLVADSSTANKDNVYWATTSDTNYHIWAAEVKPGREITIPQTVTGLLNGVTKTLNPQVNWYSYQQTGTSIKDANGRYKIVVGPKIINPSYPDSGKINANEDGLIFPVRIDISLQHKTTNITSVKECIAQRGGKAHTYKKHPDGHPKNYLSVNDTVSFNIESGLLQTGIVYPKSYNASNGSDLHFNVSHMDSSTIEFDCNIGSLDFNPSDYKLIKIVYQGAV